ncbi:MAG: hypothetical protein H7A47_01280 [Verrucomicrobiales bacterium]|nr:hypothetical protein [Verrucomicrobiales bacterium]
MSNKTNYLGVAALGFGVSLVGGATGVLGQDQVRIERLAADGSLRWSVPTPNAVSTVEWASSPQGPWRASWGELRYHQSNSLAQTAFVPTFYRISTWTNGLLTEVRPGMRMTYRAQDDNSNEWESVWQNVGTTTLVGYQDVFTWMRRPELGDSFDIGHDGNMAGMIFKATGDQVIEYEGREVLHYRDAPIGTAWTNGYRETTGTVTIVAREEIAVPAGTYQTIRHELVITNHDCCGLPARVVTWLARGVGVVRQERYRQPADAVPGRIYELQSIEPDSSPPQ